MFVNAILRIFLGEVAYIGTQSECNRYKSILEKWGREWNVDSLAIFDDGLTYYSHCLSLYIQNDREAWRDMLNIFERTKTQGKTDKTIEKKVKYFQHHFGILLRKHRARLILNEEDRHEFEDDEGLHRWWTNYYFSTYDNTLNFKPIELYQVGDQSKEVLENVLALDGNNKGNATPPKFTVAASEIEVRVRDNTLDGQYCWVKFEWDVMDDSYRLMDLFKHSGWRSNDGKWWDNSGNLRKKLNKEIRSLKCSTVETMNTPQNLYQQANNWFYIYFYWKPKDFTWARVKKAEQIVKKLVIPQLKRPFRPMNEPEKYSVVTLSM